MNDLYVATQKPEDIVHTLEANCKLKIERNVKLSYDSGGTMNFQLKSYIEDLNQKYIRLFEDNPPKDLRTLLDTIHLLSVYEMIMKILMTNGK